MTALLPVHGPSRNEAWVLVIGMINTVWENTRSEVIFGLLLEAYCACIFRDDPMEFLARYPGGNLAS